MQKKPLVACKRCKNKKLKCDDLANTCRNCLKSGATCVLVDSRSRREYRRGYVDELLQRINELKRAIQDATVPASSFTNSSSVPTSSSSTQQVPHTRYRGENNVTSLAHLVEAAVIGQSLSTQTPLNRFSTELAREQEEFVNVPVNSAPLPPIETAHKLFDAYLTGWHILHPFLLRSEIMEDLKSVYESPDPQNHTDPRSFFRVHMVFAIGAVPLARLGLHNVSPLDYFVTATNYLETNYHLPGLEPLPGLLLILSFALQFNIGTGSKWHLAQTSLRFCTERGLHRKTDNPGNPMDEQIRRRVFWAVYTNERHSSSSLGRPTCLQDEDIDIELPIDADDDLIVSGNTDAQILRGRSEVSAQVVQIRLRRITSRIQSSLYCKATERPLQALQKAVDDLLQEFDSWRDDFPLFARPRNTYETLNWRDLNYYRERLKCFRLLVLVGDVKGLAVDTSNVTQCYEAAAQVAILYQKLRSPESDKLVFNWTCVHDMMSAGLTNLLCGIVLRTYVMSLKLSTTEWQASYSQIRNTSSAIVDTLSYIAGRWSSVQKYIHSYEAIAARLSESVQAMSLDVPNVGIAEPTQPTNHTVYVPGDFDLNTDMWDAAVAAFLEEPSDIGIRDWGAIDWDAMQLNTDMFQATWTG